MPDRLALRKRVSRTRLRNLPSAPLTIHDLREIPVEFQNTLSGERFLLYDSHEDEEYENQYGRILIFATKENLRNLFRSSTWFVDGTFSCAPSIFFQLFAILAAVTQRRASGQEQTIGLPFVYALLETKQQGAYEKVFQIIVQQAQELSLEIVMPSVVMSDFELAIINAASKFVGAEKVRCCFFHLSQNVYRQIQQHGLQTQYNDATDRTLRNFSHMMVALAFVALDKVEENFLKLKDEMPADFLPVYEYFGSNYVRGKAARGRSRRVPPRYAPSLWNQYDSVLTRTARTNNISEGWHNRLQVVIGKQHPSLYAFLVELKKEQGDTEILIRQIQIGQIVRKGQDQKRKKREEQIFNIVSTYLEYTQNDEVLKYLKSIGHNIQL